MDKIIIQGLKVKALIGIYDWEREQKQDLRVDAEIGLDLHQAATTDDIRETLDYAAICNDLSILAGNSQYELLEALADSMISQLFAYKGVKQVCLTLTKPGILKNVDAVSIQLCRGAVA